MMLSEAKTILTSLRAEAESELNGSDVQPQDAAKMNALDVAVRMAQDAPTVTWLKERLGIEYRESMRTASRGTIRYERPTLPLDPWHEARARGFHLALATLQKAEQAA